MGGGGRCCGILITKTLKFKLLCLLIFITKQIALADEEIEKMTCWWVR